MPADATIIPLLKTELFPIPEPTGVVYIKINAPAKAVLLKSPYAIPVSTSLTSPITAQFFILSKLVAEFLTRFEISS